MSFAIANATSTNHVEMAADVIIDGVFTYRLISRVQDGLHTLTLRDDDRTVVARTTGEKGGVFSRDFMWNWVGQSVEEAA